MRKAILPLLFMFIQIQSTVSQTAMEIASKMSPGWNLGNTMEACGCTWLNNKLDYETGWQKTKTTQEVIDFVKSLGFKSVRIPCSWMEHMDANYNIDPKWMDRVQEVVDYCINDSLYVLLNDHYDGGWIERSFENQTPSSVNKNCLILKLMWQQIARRFLNYDHHLLFGGMNEPNACGDNSKDKKLDHETLVKYHQTFVNAVRQTGGKNTNRILVVQAPNTNIELAYEYNALPNDATPNALMLEVHYYSPYEFCMMEEDNEWMYRAYYWGKGNHLDGSNHNATWGEEPYIQEQMRMMKNKYASKGIPVILGEFGSTWRSMQEGESQEKHDNSTYSWYKAVCRYGVYNGLIPFVWDTNYCARPSGAIIDREELKVFNQFALDGIIDGCASVKYPYINDINELEIEDSKTSNIYNLMGMRLSKEPEKGIYIKDGKKYQK